MKPDLWFELFKAALAGGHSASVASQIAENAVAVVGQRRGADAKLTALLRACDALGSVSGPSSESGLYVPRHLLWPVFEAAAAVKEAAKP